MIKMKLSLAATSIAALFAFSNTAHSGIYVGISGGYSKNTLKFDDNDEDEKDPHFKGIPVGAHVGYEHFASNRFFTAAEIGGDVLPQSKKFSSTFEDDAGDEFTLDSKVKKSYSVDLAAKAGYSFGSFTPYVRLGVVGTSWELKSKLTQNNRSRSAKAKDFVFGITPGVGLQLKVANNWRAGIEYKYVHYGKFSKNVFGDKTEFKPRVHDVRARLSYGF